MDELFDLPPTEAGPAEPEGRARPRLQRPQRDQITLRPSDLESLLPADHQARLVWAFVEGLDLAPLYDRIRAVEGHPGRPPIDPAILVSLWLYATLEGSAAPGRSTACAPSTTPTAGLPAGSASTTTPWPPSGSTRPTSSTGSSPRASPRCWPTAW